MLQRNTTSPPDVCGGADAFERVVIRMNVARRLRVGHHDSRKLVVGFVRERQQAVIERQDAETVKRPR